MLAGNVKLAVQRALMVPDDGILGGVTIGAFNRLVATPNAAEWPPEKDDPVVIGTMGGIPIYKDRMGVVSFIGSAAIDADGAPDCYHPNDASGRDALACAGHPGNWWGIVTDTDHLANRVGKGIPLIQGVTAPAFSPATRGFYVSTTALADNPELPISDQRRYVNPDEVQFIVLPSNFPVKVRLGTRTRVTYNGRSVEGIFADIGPRDEVGELSTSYAVQLGIPPNPRKGGIAAKVVRYEIFI